MGNSPVPVTGRHRSWMIVVPHHLAVGRGRPLKSSARVLLPRSLLGLERAEARVDARRRSLQAGGQGGSDSRVMSHDLSHDLR